MQVSRQVACGVIIKEGSREVLEVSPTHITQTTVEIFRVRVIIELRYNIC